MKYLALNISHLRKSNKVTQEQLAQYVGVKRTNISNWEKKVSRPSLEHLHKIAKFFDIQIDDLIGTDLSKMSPNFRHLSSDSVHLTEFTRPEKAVYGYTEDELEPHQVNEPITIHNTVRNVMVGIGLQESYVAGWDDEERAKNTVTAILPGLRGDVRTFQISGESMRPALEDGDWIACRPATIATIKEGHMYAIVHKELIVSVKYVYRYVGGLLLVPANRQVYKPITIEEGEVIEIWEAALRLTSRLTQLPQLGAWQDQERKITQLEQFIKNLFPDYGELDGDI